MSSSSDSRKRRRVSNNTSLNNTSLQPLPPNRTAPSVQPARTRGPAEPPINWAKGMPHEEPAQRIGIRGIEFAPSAANPVNKSLFQSPIEHQFRSQRERELRALEREFAGVLANVHKEMYEAYQVAAKEGEQLKKIAEHDKAIAHREFEAQRAKVTNQNVPKLKALLQTELDSIDERIAGLVQQHATRISNHYDKVIADNYKQFDKYMEDYYNKWEQEIKHYYQEQERREQERLAYYEQLKQQENAILSPILQRHSDVLNEMVRQQVAGREITPQELEQTLSSQRQEIEHVKQHFQRLRAQVGGSRRTMRRKRSGKRSGKMRGNYKQKSHRKRTMRRQMK